MSSKISGLVHLIEDTKTYGTSGFRKRTIVLEQNKGSFTNFIPIEFTKDLCDEVNDVSVGDEMTVNFRLNGRKWQKDAESEVRFFLSAEAMSFETLKKQQPKREASKATVDDDDIPF